MAAQFVPRVSWAKFSLRTLLIGIALLAIWLASQTNRARNQERAVAALTDLQVQIGYDWHYDEKNPLQSIPNASPPGPEWLRGAIGEHYFAHVVKLNFEQTRTQDSDLKNVDSLPHVRWLSLYDTSVTNEGMKYIRALPRIETLYLFGTQVGDDGLKHVANLISLRELQCWGNPISDAGLAHLSQLTRLEKLLLSHTEITDAGLKHIRTLAALRELDLGFTCITDEGLAHLSDLAYLEKLWLNGSQVQLTAPGSRHLQKLKNLKYLNLRGTSLSKRDIEALKASLPNCTIEDSFDISPPHLTL